MATELMAEVALQIWPGMQVASVSDLSVLHGIVIRNGSETVRVEAKARAATTDEVLYVDVKIATQENPERPHYRGTVVLTKKLPGPPPFEPLPPSHVIFVLLPGIWTCSL